jgi:hypothetical protein
MGRMKNYSMMSWYNLQTKTNSTRFKLYIKITTCKILSLMNTHVMLCVGARLLCERGEGSGERGAGILRAWSRNYCPGLINIKIPLEIEI